MQYEQSALRAQPAATTMWTPSPDGRAQRAGERRVPHRLPALL